MSAADSSINVLGTGTFPVDVSLGTDVNTLAQVYRQRMVIGDDIDFSMLASVSGPGPNPNDPALSVRLASGSPEIADLKELLFLLYSLNQQTLELLQQKLPVVDEYARAQTVTYPPPAFPINISGTITTGGTAQLLFRATNVRGFDLQNQSSAQALGFSWWTPSPVIGNANTYQLSVGSPGGYYSTPPTFGILEQVAVYVIGATTSQAFTGCYW